MVNCKFTFFLRLYTRKKETQSAAAAIGNSSISPGRAACQVGVVRTPGQQATKRPGSISEPGQISIKGKDDLVGSLGGLLHLLSGSLHVVGGSLHVVSGIVHVSSGVAHVGGSGVDGVKVDAFAAAESSGNNKQSELLHNSLIRDRVKYVAQYASDIHPYVHAREQTNIYYLNLQEYILQFRYNFY